jgi:hypothetical protein
MACDRLGVRTWAYVQALAVYILHSGVTTVVPTHTSIHKGCYLSRHGGYNFRLDIDGWA